MENAHILKEPYFRTYRGESRSDRRDILREENVVLTFADNYSTYHKDQEIGRLKKLGYMPISLRFILGGVVFIASSEAKDMPFPMYQSAKDLEGLSKKVRANILQQQNIYK